MQFNDVEMLKKGKRGSPIPFFYAEFKALERGEVD